MTFALVILCFTLSGFAALVYQTAWTRLFAVAFGTSEIAIAIVLAGYMAGLALGAAVAGRFADRIRRPVLVYGVLEGAIAIAALLLPILVNLTGDLYIAVAGNLPTPPDASTFAQPLYYSIASFLVLLIPTALMGATLPLLARYVVTSDRNLGARVSALYAMNTFGAVGGVLAAGFLILPALGLRGTVWVGVLVNGIVFVLALLLARYATDERPAAPTRLEPAQAGRQSFVLMLPLIAASGVYSFIYEILWTRMLSHVLGGSIYAFATMLAAFLTGITLGAAGAGLLAKNPRQATLLFGLCQFGIALTSALVYSRLETWVPAGLSHAALAFAVILPSSMFIGATYPLAVRAYAGGVEHIGRSTALVYSWNTVGSIAGALLGGFVVIPAFGFAGTAKFAVASNLLIGLAAILLVTRFSNRRQLLQASAAIGVAVVLFLSFRPQRPDALVTRALFGGSSQQLVDEIYYAVGRSSTVLLTENVARFDLSSNGLPEAQIEFRGAPPMLLSQRWLALWPSLARPDTSSMLIVGLGGGVVVEGVDPNIETVHVVELEHEVVAANARIGERRQRDPLTDARVQVVVNDARNALRLTNRKYDAVVSQPSHPWTAGASHLFTREFFALVKSRLNDNGVFVQWMNAEFLDEELLRKLAATLLAEFDYVRIYQPSSLALHFVASNSPLNLEQQIAQDGRPIGSAPAHYAGNRILRWTDIVPALLADETATRELASGQNIITDDDNRMAVDTNASATGLDATDLNRLLARFDPLQLERSVLRRRLSDEQIAYIVRRLLLDGQRARVEGIIESATDDSCRRLLRAMVLLNDGRQDEAQQLLLSIVPGQSLYELSAYLQWSHGLMPPPASNGSAMEEATPLAALPDSGFSSTLAAAAMGVADDWSGLQGLDQALARIKPDALWFADAQLLRAEWRLRRLPDDAVLAAEALELVDRAIASNPRPAAYKLRAEAAVAVNNDAVLIESAAWYASAVDTELWSVDYYGSRLATGRRQEMLASLLWLEEHLRPRLNGPAKGRATTVLSKVAEARLALSAG